MAQQAETVDGRAYVAFRQYLLDGEHHRVGKRLNAVETAPGFSGWSLHRSGYGDDGQTGQRQFNGAYLEHLEQAWVEQLVARDLPASQWRHSRVQQALRAVADDRPEEIEALRYYLKPEGRRVSLTKMAATLGTESGNVRRLAMRGVDLVWDELGGVW